MQQRPIGFLAAWKARIAVSSDGSTAISAASPCATVAWLHRFLAAPNPPGTMSAAYSVGSREVSGAICPRAMRADSTRTFLGAESSSPFVWSTTWCCTMSGAKHAGAKPAAETCTRVATASVISEPSYTPLPASTTAIFLGAAVHSRRDASGAEARSVPSLTRAMMEMSGLVGRERATRQARGACAPAHHLTLPGTNPRPRGG
mmetsp:Transcript_24287/g.79112  ORF Transcript_24287/g.79112 Transcript_24287/m.79112 type:complete len:203 (-) Transcript_24287:10-618(-)